MWCEGKFRPSLTDPQVCRWWMVPSNKVEAMWRPFCCHNDRMGVKCPTEGKKPYEPEEDSFE